MGIRTIGLKQFSMNANGSIPNALRATLIFALTLAFACFGTLQAADSSETTAANLNGGMPGDWDQCEVPQRISTPAAGHWKGFYRLVIEIKQAPVIMHIKTEGSLEFELGRYEALPDVPHPSPPHYLLRTPLKAPLLGDFPVPTEANAEIEASIEKALAEAEGNYQGLHVGKYENAKIEGKATYSAQTSANISMPGLKNDAKGTFAPMELEVRAEEDPASGQFKEIRLWGFRDQLTSAFQGVVDVAGADSQSHDQADFHGGSLNNHGYTVDSTGKHNFSATTAASMPHEQIGLVRLNVVSQDCWLMQGTVNSQRMGNASNAGFGAVVTESEWSATLDERDVGFERSVKALADEPIPSPLTWDYIEHFTAQWMSLRKSGKLTDYRLCVLKDLDRKGVEITVAGVRELVKDFPKVHDMGNACAAMTVVGAALQRILPLERRLELEGIECPLTNSWREVVNSEMRELVKNTLGRKSSFDELCCLVGWSAYRYGIFNYGDQGDLLDRTWTDEAQRRLNARNPSP
jgi:hypothetical protein